MGTIACSVIVNRAAKTLFDETNVRWPATELLDYFNAALTWLVLNKPDAYVQIGQITLAAGPLQTLPAGGTLVMNVLENLGANGTTVGKPIRQIERNELDHNNPDWLTQTGDSVLHWTFDKRDPKHFYVFPQPVGTWYVRALWSATPPRVTNVGDALPVDDLYETPLSYFVIGYALLKNSKSGDAAKAGSYLAMASNLIGLKMQMQAAFSPVDPDVAAKTGQDV